LADQSTNSIIRFPEDIQQGCLSSVEGFDFELAPNLQLLSPE
jgi:hypothetical protein